MLTQKKVALRAQKQEVVKQVEKELYILADLMIQNQSNKEAGMGTEK